MSDLAPAEEVRPGLAFGPFRLHPAERLLERDGEPIQVGGRAMDLLIRLTDRPGEIVPKRDLIASAWPDLTVEESSLRFHIVNLRKALGDGQSGTRYITNVSGRGYCFVAPVAAALGGRGNTAPAGPAVQPGTHDLPRQHDHIIGRADTILHIARQLEQRRFVTIHGPGGIGKTTVAVAVAHARLAAFDGQVHFLDLGTVTDKSLVAGSLASSLGLTTVTTDSAPAVIDYLRERRVLVIFDCCEHVIEAVAELAERLYQEAPRVSLLTTSRERLRVEGENAFSLAPLSLPPTDASLSVAEMGRFSAPQLFIDRAAAAFADEDIGDRDAAIIADICRKLDGNALAIELVAGQVPKYGLEETSNLLDGKLALLMKGRRTAIPRHQTLKATVEWSYQLLDEAQKRLLQRLSIFVGPFGLRDAEVVGGGGAADEPDVLTSLEALIEKSLVMVQREAGTVRYRLLDSTKAYAGEKLTAGGEVRSLTRRYAGHIVEILRKRRSETLPPATARAENRLLLGDASAALRWSFSTDGDRELAPVLAAGASSLFISLSMLNECRRWCESALDILPDSDGTARTAMELNAALGHSLMLTEGNRDRARIAMERALELAERLDDKPNQFRLLSRLHMYFRRTGEISRLVPIARQLEALANALGDAVALSAAHTLLSVGYHLAGDQFAAQTHIDVVFHLNEYDNVQPSHYAFHRSPYIASARCRWLLGYPDQAVAMASVLEDRAGAPDAVTYCIALIWGATVFQWTRDWKRVDAFAKRLIVHARDHSLRPYQVVGLAIEGETLLADGQLNAGLAILRSSVATLHAEQYELYTPRFEGAMAEALLQLKRPDEARALIDRTIGKIAADGPFYETPDLLRIRGKIQAFQKDAAGARQSLAEAAEMADRQGALGWRLRAAVGNVEMSRGTGFEAAALADLQATYDKFTEGFGTPDMVDARALFSRQ